VQLTLVTPPAAEPVSLADARLHLRLDATGGPPATHPDDALVTSLLAVARKYLDGRDGVLGRALITQTWRLDLPAFPAWDAPLRLPLPPLQSVTSIAYVDHVGVVQTLDPALYETVTGDWGAGIVRPVYGTGWPSARAQSDAVRITFVAGYGTTGAAVPEPLLHAMKLHIGVLYENREAAAAAANMAAVPLAYDALVTPYVYRWF
jgi:uncharacterized phiE125 gp8 family phage protein